MVKTLRSFIHEKIPLDLRVDLDLLSRRRDLRGEEKQEEVINLLRKYDVGDVVQLGPGTNRYGLKLDGFVLKVATDHDGKVDNLKEFKMAKVMFPKVPKTYEVSENGSLLVAEYVIPFGSYSEMMMYAGKIRDILTEFSSVFLIGDVGLTSKNYANWGLRVGTEEVVCLDFAYVYDATSDLFICRHCNTNTMLVPNKDFTKLVCPNKACQKETTFENIKSMISNEYHMKQIGDLSKEGYLMETSGVATELTEDKSNYLVKRKRKIKPRSECSEPEEESVETINDDILEKEDIEMFKNEVTVNAIPTPKHPFSGLVVNGLGTKKVDPKAAVDLGNLDEDEEKETVFPVFRSKVDPKAAVDLGNLDEDEEESYEDDAESQDTEDAEEYYGDADADAEEVVEQIVNEIVDDIETSNQVNDDQIVDADNPNIDPHVGFSKKFCAASYRAISNIANSIKEALHIDGLFDDIKNLIVDKKMYPEQFYIEAGNAIFKSMVSYLEAVECDVANKNNNGTHREFRVVFDVVNSEGYGKNKNDMLRIIERFFNTRAVNSQDDFFKAADMYESIYGDINFPYEWIGICSERLASKMRIMSSGINLFEACLRDICRVKIDEQIPDEDQETTNEDEEESYEDDAESQDTEDAEEYYGDADADAEEGSENIHLTVEIFNDDDFDVIKLKSGDAFGSNDIPLYVNLDSVSADPTFEGMVDPRNGVWDWLAHMVPDVMFRTKNPDQYISYNNVEPEEMQGHVVVLGQDSEGYSILGIFMLAGIYVVDDDFNYILMFQEEVLAKINRAISDAIGHSAVSHRMRSISITELIHDERYIDQFFVPLSTDGDDEEEDGDQYEDEARDDVEDEEVLSVDEPRSGVDVAVEAISEAEEAAVMAMMGSSNEPKLSPTEKSMPNQATNPNTANEMPANENGIITPQRRRRK